MTVREKWTQALTVPGGLAVLIGGFDPLDGAVVVLAGTALLAAAATVAPCDRGVRTMRAMNFVLTAFGCVAIWILSAQGGVGEATGRSFLWAFLGLPLVAGWSLSFWSRAAPRWMTWLGLLAGGWYLSLPLLAAAKARANPHLLWSVLAAIGACGLVTLSGCVWRLRRPRPIAGNT